MSVTIWFILYDYWRFNMPRLNSEKFQNINFQPYFAIFRGNHKNENKDFDEFILYLMIVNFLKISIPIFAIFPQKWKFGNFSEFSLNVCHLNIYDRRFSWYNCIQIRWKFLENRAWLFSLVCRIDSLGRCYHFEKSSILQSQVLYLGNRDPWTLNSV